MNKTQRLAKARAIRAHLARFTDLQKPALAEHVRTEFGADPEYTAMNHLHHARFELSELIASLEEQGYGKD